MVLYLIPLALAVIGWAAWLMWERREDERQRQLVARIRKSELYGHVYPELKRCGERLVETITIRPEAISIRFLHPVGETRTCSFETLGFDQLAQGTLYALAQAVSVDLDLDSREYTFVTHKEQLPDGTPWRWYEYCITSVYKDELMRGLLRTMAE